MGSRCWRNALRKRDESPSPLPLRLALLLFIIRRALDQCTPELASLGSVQFRDIDQEGPLDSLLPQFELRKSGAPVANIRKPPAAQIGPGYRESQRAGL